MEHPKRRKKPGDLLENLQGKLSTPSACAAVGVAGVHPYAWKALEIQDSQREGPEEPLVLSREKCPRNSLLWKYRKGSRVEDVKS